MPTGITPEVRFHLPASDRPKRFYQYYVTGRGPFPFDMLRYDSAWPATGNDVHAMVYTERERRSIMVNSYTEPTVERWNSFGWKVSAEKEKMHG